MLNKSKLSVQELSNNPESGRAALDVALTGVKARPEA